VGFVVSAVAHIVAVMLVILVVERITSLPGLFIDLTTHATELGDGSGAGAPPPRPKARPAAPGRAPARAGPRASDSPATSARVPVVEPRAEEPAPPSMPTPPPVATLDIPRAAPPPPIASETSGAAPVANAAPPSNAAQPANAAQPNAALRANVVGSESALSSERSAPLTGTAGPSEAMTGGAGRGSVGGGSATVADDVPAGGGIGARAGQGLALATPSVGTGAGPGGGGPPAAYAEYLARLRQRIQESLHYPLPARRRGLSGTVHLDVIIQPDGAVGAVTVVGSSSHESLDEAALETVRGLGAMPFPTGVPPRRLRVRVPVVFELR